MTPDKRKSAAAWLSVVSNATLITLKVVVGVLMGSVSVISEAIHSGVDLVASVIALFAVKESAKPADEKHPFGHGKFENISGTIEALLIFVAAAWIIYEAVKKLLFPPGELDFAGWGVLVMFCSAAANWLVSRRLFKVGKETDSVALQADAWHLRTDVYTSAGVMTGLLLIWGGEAVVGQMGWKLDLHWIDPMAALLVAMLIIRAAVRLTVRSARDLMDIGLPDDEQQWIRDLLTNFSPTVHGYHKLRTRKAGAIRFVEFHIRVDGKMSVQDSHRLAHEVSDRIKQHFDHANVIVHVEPCDGRCTLECCGNVTS